MHVDISEIIRKMVMLGIPLLPLGCDSFSSCPDTGKSSPTFTRQLTIANPERAALDGGMPTAAEREAFRKCVQEGQCLALCRTQEFQAQSCVLVGDDAGVGERDTVTLQATVTVYCEGRRTGRQRGPRAATRRPPDGSPVADWLLAAACLERGSVPAFQRLAAELTAHGAPGALIESARQAVADERRHERMMTGLHRRFAARPQTRSSDRRAARLPVRSLVAMAAENAREGCVRETLGAVMASWQGTWAGDHGIRAAMKLIAHDEARHAALAWQVHAWAQPRLPPAARRRVARALAAEARAVTAACTQASEQSRELIAQAGMPPAAVTRQMAAAATVLLWAPAAGGLA